MTKTIASGKMVALEIVPPAVERGGSLMVEEAYKVRSLLQQTGLAAKVNTILVPQLVPEDDGRPIALQPRLDPLEVRQAFSGCLRTSFILSQVTAHSPPAVLHERVGLLQSSGVERIIFVGAPRQGGPGLAGLSPEAALVAFRGIAPSMGVILIPTRIGEKERFLRKLEAGAGFAVTQLLFSNHIVYFLREMAAFPFRPEILLSFGYVPKVEVERGLLRWLIRDDKSPFVEQESDRIMKLAGLPVEQRRAALVASYKAVVQEAAGLGFPLGVHFECPYGVSSQALETFASMLDAWSP